MALKLDMSKAYDKFEWGFLEAMLLKLGFVECWVKWIMVCVSIILYACVINGEPIHFFKPQRGISGKAIHFLYSYLDLCSLKDYLVYCREMRELSLLLGSKWYSKLWFIEFFYWWGNLYIGGIGIIIPIYGRYTISYAYPPACEAVRPLD